MSWSVIFANWLYILVFALLSSASVAAIAAPTAKPVSGNASLMQERTPKVQGLNINLNVADAPTLQRELAGMGEAKAKTEAIVAYS